MRKVRRAIGLHMIEQGIDTATMEGRAMFGMLSVLAELQRELIIANTMDGLASGRALAQQLYNARVKTAHDWPNQVARNWPCDRDNTLRLNAAVRIDMWFDAKCPWAWNTSRWLLEVERVRDVQVRFHAMSLAILNEGRNDLEDWYRKWLRDTLAPARVMIAAEQAHGNDVLGDLYTALGTLIHHDKMPIGRELFTKALVAAGLPEQLADAAGTADYDEALLASHRAGLDPVGEDLGTPVIHVPAPDGSVNAFFGPVVTPVPRGEAAGRLWDGTLLVTASDGFFELKRGRTRPPRVD